MSPEFTNEQYFWNQNGQLVYTLDEEKASQRKVVSTNRVDSIVLEINPALLSRHVTTQNITNSYGGFMNEVSLHDDYLPAFQVDYPHTVLSNTANVSISWSSNPTADFEVVEQWLLKQEQEGAWIIEDIIPPEVTSVQVATEGVYVVRKLAMDGRYVDSDGELSGFFNLDAKKRKVVSFDTVAPEMESLAVVTGDPAQGEPAFSIQAEVSEPIQGHFEVIKNGDVYYKETLQVNSDAFSYEWDGRGRNGLHEDGEYSIVFFGNDAAGNRSNITTADITLDFSPPVIKPLQLLSDLAFSPNRDGAYDVIELGFEYSEPVSVSLNVLNESGVVAASYAFGQAVTTNTIQLDDTYVSATKNHVFNAELVVKDRSEKVTTLAVSVLVDIEPSDISIESSDIVVTSTEPVVPIRMGLSEPSHLDMTVLGESVASFSMGAGVHTLTFDGSTLEDGLHTVEIFAYDSVMNESVVTIGIVVDTTPPVITSLMVPSTANITDEFIVRVDLEDASPSDDIVLFLEDATGHRLFSAAVSSNQDIDVSPLLGPVSSVLDDGEYTLKLRLTDEYHNVTESVSTVFVGVSNPVISMSIQPIVGFNELFSIATFNISLTQGTLETIGDVQVKIFDEDFETSVVAFEASNQEAGDIVVTWNGMFSDSLVEDGVYVVDVEVHTMFGEVVSKHVSFVLDASAPTLDVVSVFHETFNPSKNSLSVDASFLDASGALLSYKASIDGVPIIPTKKPSGMDISFSFNGILESRLPDGEHKIDVDVMDNVGNVLRFEVPFTIDTTPPAFLGLSVSPNVILPDGDGIADSVDIQLSSTEKVTPKVLVKNQEGDLIRDLSPDFSHTDWDLFWNGKSSTHSLSDGDYVLSIQLLDEAGNMSSVTLNTISVLDSKPSLSDVMLLAPAVNPKKDAVFSFYASHQGEVSAALYKADKTFLKELPPLAVNQGYNELFWDTSASDVSLSDGDYILSLGLRSAQGVESGNKLDVVFQVDGTAPVMDIVSDVSTVSYPDFVVLNPTVKVVESVTLNVELFKEDGTYVSSILSELIDGGSHDIDLNFESLSLENGNYLLRFSALDSVENSLVKETPLSVLELNGAEIKMGTPFSVLTPDGDSVQDTFQLEVSFLGTGFPYVTAGVYTESGILVRELFDDESLSSVQILQWDGLDKENELVDAGVYELKLTSRDDLGQTVESVHPIHVFLEPIALDVYISDPVVSFNNDGVEDEVEFRVVPNLSSDFDAYDYLSKTLMIDVVWTQNGVDIESDLVQVEDEYIGLFSGGAAVSGDVLLSLSGESKDRIPVQITTINILNDTTIESDIGVASSIGIVSEFSPVVTDTLYLQSDIVSLQFEANDIEGFIVQDSRLGTSAVIPFSSPVFSPTTLVEGDNLFHYSAYDAAGNRTPTYSIRLVLDTLITAPQLLDYVTYVSQNSVSLVVSADVGVTVSVSVDENVVISKQHNENPSSYSLILEEGDYNIDVSVSDLALNTVQLSDILLVVDTTPPVVTNYTVVNAGFEADVATLNEGVFLVNASVVDVYLEATEFDTVVVQNDGDVLSADTALTHTNIPLSEGEHSLSFMVVDKALNSTVVPDVTVNVDASISSPYFQSWQSDVNTETIEVSVVSEIGATVSVFVNDVEVESFLQTLNSETRFLTLSEGEHSVSLRSEDSAGNISTTVRYGVEVDLTRPEVNHLSVKEADSGEVVEYGDYYWLNTSEVFFDLSLSEASQVNMTVNGEDYYVLDNISSFESDSNAFSDGVYEVVLFVSDDAGNEADVVTLNLVVDTQISDPILFSRESLWNSDSVSVSVRADEGVTVDILVDNTVVDSYFHSQETMVRTLIMTEGDHDVHAVVTDVAGNVAETEPYAISVDLTLPIIESVAARESGHVTVGDYILDVDVSEEITGEFLLVLDDTEIIGEYVSNTIVFDIPAGLDGIATLNPVTFQDEAGNFGEEFPEFSVFIDSEFPLIESYDVQVSTNRGDLSQLRVEIEFSEPVELAKENVVLRLENNETLDPVTLESSDAATRYYAYYDVAALDEDIDVVISEFADVYGNTTFSKTLYLGEVDNIAPVVSGLGANVSVFSSKRLVDDASVTITLNVDEDYESLIVRVTDSAGNLVKTLLDRADFAGDVAMVWNGLDNDGNTLEKGWYITEAWAKDEYGNESLHAKGVFEVTEQHLFLEVTSGIALPYSGNTDTALAYQYSVQQRVDSPDDADRPDILPMMKQYTTAVGRITESIYKVSEDGGEDTLIAVLVSKNATAAFTGSSLGRWKGRLNNVESQSLVESGEYYVKVEVESFKGTYEDVLTIPFTVDHDIPELSLNFDGTSILSQQPNAFNILSLDVDIDDAVAYPTLNVQLLAFNRVLDAEVLRYQNGRFIVSADISTLETLSDGDYDVTVNVRDLAGNLSSSKLSVRLDNTFPDLSFSIPSRNGVVSNNIQFKDVVVEDVSEVQLRYSTGFMTEFVDASELGSDTFQGESSVLLEAIDEAGNRRVFTRPIRVDNHIQKPAPIVKGNGFVTENSVELSDLGISEDDIERVYYRVNSGDWEEFSPEGLSSLPFEYPDGEYVISIKFEDSVGNHSDVFTKALIKDTTKPVVTHVELSGSRFFTDTYYTNALDVTRWVPELASDSENDVTMQYRFVSEEGDVFTPASVIDGTYALSARAIDFAGNISDWVEVGNFVLDTTEPSVLEFEVSSGEEWIGTSVPRTLSYDINDVAVNYVTVNIMKVMSEGNLSHVRSWEYKSESNGVDVRTLFSGLSEGEYRVGLSVEDKAGNSIVSEPLTVKYDASAPQFSLSVPSIYMNDLIINVDNLVELGSGEVDYLVKGYKLNHVFTPGESIPEAVTWVQDAITVTATDKAGNSRTVPLGITVTVDKYSPSLHYLRVDNLTEYDAINPYENALDVRLKYSPQSSVDSGFDKYVFRLIEQDSGTNSVIYERTRTNLTWQYLFTGLDINANPDNAAGRHILQVDVYDKAGNMTQFETEAFTIDSSAPTFVGAIDARNNATQVKISENEYLNIDRDGLFIHGTVNDDNGIGRVFYKTGDFTGEASDFAIVLTSETLPVQEGTNDVEVWVEDIAGNRSQSRVFQIIVDRVAPVVSKNFVYYLNRFYDDLRSPGNESKLFGRFSTDEGLYIESAFFRIVDEHGREWMKADFSPGLDRFNIYWNGFIKVNGLYEQAPSIFDYYLNTVFVDKAGNTTEYNELFKINWEIEIQDTRAYPPYSPSIQLDDDGKWYLKYGVGDPYLGARRVNTKTYLNVRDGDNDHFRSIPHPFIVDIKQTVYFEDENWRNLSNSIYRPIQYWKDSFSNASSHYRMELFEYTHKSEPEESFIFPIPELNGLIDSPPYSDFDDDFSKISWWPRNYTTGDSIRYTLPSQYEGKVGFLSDGTYLREKHPEGGGTTLNPNFYYLMAGIKNYHSEDYHEHMSLSVRYSYYELGYKVEDINAQMTGIYDGFGSLTFVTPTEKYGPTHPEKTEYTKWNPHNDQVNSKLFYLYDVKNRFIPLINSHNGSDYLEVKNGYWYYIPKDYPVLPATDDIVDISIETADEDESVPFIGIAWVKQTNRRQLFYKTIYKGMQTNIGTQEGIEFRKVLGVMSTDSGSFSILSPKVVDESVSEIYSSTPEFKWTVPTENLQDDTLFKIQLKKTTTVEDAALPTFTVVEGVDPENNQTVLVRSYKVSGTSISFIPGAQDSLGNTDDNEVYQWQVQADWDGDGVYDETSTTSEVFSVNAPLAIESAINYPNPFKKQTYIRYKLNADAKSVTVRIFDVAGRVVRTFKRAPSSKASGANEYHDVYWDGKNGVGDPVLNGVYIYKIIAKDFNGRTVRKTGKMARLR
jgi:flagellar hook assembly protein FlgD